MSIKEDLKIPLSMLSISFLDESKYKGSYQGKRFMFEKIVDENGKMLLRVYLWKDIYNFEMTDIKDKIVKDFTYDTDGIDQGLRFVEETNL